MQTADREIDRNAGRAIAAAGVAAGVVLLGLGLGEKGLWLDEALSVWRATTGWDTLWREVTTTQANMGLYYLLLHAWIPIAGTTEAAVRTLSVVFAAATLPAVFLLARSVFGVRAGLYALVLLALNSFFIRYGQEARGYSLVLLLVTLATLAWVRALERPALRSRWAAYVLAGSLAAYAHLFAVLVLIAHAVALIRFRRDAIPWRSLLAVWSAMAILTAPLAAFVLFRDVGQIDWIPAPRALDVLYTLRALTGDAGWILAGGYALACVMSLRRQKARAPSESHAGFRAVFWAWLLVPVCLAVAVSAVKPVLQARYLIVALPPLVILAAAGLASLRPRALAAVSLAVMLFLSAIGVRRWHQEPDRQYWRDAARFVMSRAEPGDAVGFYVYSGRVPFEYYVDRLGLRRAGVDLVDLTSERYIAGGLQPDPSGVVLGDLAARRPRVWIVRLQDGAPPGHPLRRYEQRQAIETALGGAMTRSTDVAFPGGIRVQRYDR